jgi:hypothetical protein
MNRKQLLTYELPSISEYISFGWGQSIIAYFVGRKINRKLKRYNKRLEREKFVKSYNLIK